MEQQQIPNPEVTGAFFFNTIEWVKKLKGEAGLAELKKIYGDIDQYLVYKWYPMKDHLRINNAAVQIVYGLNTPENQFKFGEGFFDTFANGIAGRTVLAFAKNSFERALENGPKMWHLVSSSTIEIEMVSREVTRTVIKGDVHDANSLGGVLSGFAAFIGFPAAVELVTWKDYYFEYQTTVYDPSSLPKDFALKKVV